MILIILIYLYHPASVIIIIVACLRVPSPKWLWHVGDRSGYASILRSRASAEDGQAGGIPLRGISIISILVLLLTNKYMSKDLEMKRHSLAHLMAAAVLKLYPQAKFGIGPVIENGFYYDIDLGDTALSPEDLTKIQKLMKEMIKEGLVFEKKEVSIEGAINIFKKKKQDYKLELLKDLQEKGSTVISKDEEKSAFAKASADKAWGKYVKCERRMNSDGVNFGLIRTHQP